MLRSGRSLSGHERNCCFLNSGGDRFADVSAAVGLDLDDDGRVLALADWDYDGDIDFWVANRSGPQVRFLRNELQKGNSFLAARLQGVTCNRDAIGARVTVVCNIRGKEVIQSRTLRAGEGYLAQNSKWLHFGLGDAEHIKRLEVRWPNGARQDFGTTKVNQWLRIREGDQPSRWQPPATQRDLVPKAFEAPPVSDQARIVLLRPLPAPAISFEDSAGTRQLITANQGRSRIVNLWASWCQPCLEELAEWNAHADHLEAAGLDVLALNVDVELPDRAAKVATVLSALSLPFDIGSGSAETVTQFDLLQRSLLSRQRPLPVPTSFLIDGEGRLRVMYKGQVDAETLLRDATLLTASAAKTLAAATPFEGRWLVPPGGSTPLHLAVKYAEGGFIEECISYVETLLDQRETHPEYISASLMNVYAAALLDRGEFKQAISAFQESLRLDPTNRQAHVELGTVLLGGGRGRQAIPHFERALLGNATDPELLFKLGAAQLQAGELEASRDSLTKSVQLRPSANAYWQLGNVATQVKDAMSAVEAYERAVTLSPRLLLSANNLAWLLATSSDQRARHGERAVEIAKAICDASGAPSASALDTLAAAYAEIGEYAEATKTAARARDTALRNGEPSLAARIQGRQELYEAGKPFRESF